MAEASRRDPVRSFSNRIFPTISGRWFRAYSIVRHVGRTLAVSIAIRSRPTR
jgi:hypothetical protein